MIDAINGGLHAGLSVLGTILGIMVFIMIVRKGPGIFKDLAELITTSVRILVLKLKIKLTETKKEPVEEEPQLEDLHPTFEEFEEWMKWKRSAKS